MSLCFFCWVDWKWIEDIKKTYGLFDSLLSLSLRYNATWREGGYVYSLRPLLLKELITAPLKFTSPRKKNKPYIWNGTIFQRAEARPAPAIIARHQAF